MQAAVETVAAATGQSLEAVQEFAAAAAQLTGWISEVQATELEEAADAWQRGEWADAPRRADIVQDRIAAAEFVGAWIRRRAARKRAGEADRG